MSKDMDVTRDTGGALILAVETSSRMGSVALARGADLLEESRFSAPLQHSAELFPTIERLLKRHGRAPPELEQVHISLGPGSFTGLRIAVALAKAMHLANAVRIVTVDSLDVVAANASEALADGSSLQEVAMPGRIVTLFDAKRGQFYAAAYERILPSPDEHKSPEEEPPYQIPAPGNAVWRKIVPDCLVTASEILGRLAAPDRIGLLGDGLLYQRDKFDTDRTVILPPQYWSPRAAGVHLLGWQKARAGRFADPLTLTPFYLRGPQVTLRKGS